MRIIFVRHGHPDYRKDCLTELGHLQAEAAAQRLKNEQPAAIYCSSHGRAVQTAEHIAAVHGLDVIPCDFIRELNWGSVNGEPLPDNGHPWMTVDAMVRAGQSLRDPDWTQNSPFTNNIVGDSITRINTGTDAWLQTLGYEREGEFFRVRSQNDSTVMMVSHGGASAAALAHIFGLTFPLMCKIYGCHHTSITVVKLHGQAGELICPQFELLNDHRHIDGISTENVFGK
ncbi:MAG: histidine phosphatase family protein [Clostridia bacterium]|nr:histidine phosphatase family protein [Clostridia bacterium]